jgi:hypothetical protein
LCVVAAGVAAAVFLKLLTVNYSVVSVNPLTPELNPSAQRCLTRFFTVDFAS